MHFLLIKTLMIFNISWVALNIFWHNSSKWKKNHKNLLWNLLQLKLLQVVPFLYIANHLSYKCRHGLNICKKNELEFTFIEIVHLKKSNIIVGIIYWHPSTDLTEFNCNYLNYQKICTETMGNVHKNYTKH